MAEDRSVGSLLENVHQRLTTVDNVTEQTDEQQSQVINVSLTSFKFFVLMLCLCLCVFCHLYFDLLHLCLVNLSGAWTADHLSPSSYVCAASCCFLQLSLKPYYPHFFYRIFFQVFFSHHLLLQLCVCLFMPAVMTYSHHFTLVKQPLVFHLFVSSVLIFSHI